MHGVAGRECECKLQRPVSQSITSSDGPVSESDIRYGPSRDDALGI